MNTMKRIAAIVMAISMVLTIVSPITAHATTKVKLNKTKATLTMTDANSNPTVDLKVNGTSKNLQNNCCG